MPPQLWQDLFPVTNKGNIFLFDAEPSLNKGCGCACACICCIYCVWLYTN